MKKHMKKIVIIVVALVVIIIGLLIVFIKPSIDADTFIKKAEENGFTVIEKTEENGYGEEDGFRTDDFWMTVYLATHKEHGYQVELFLSDIQVEGDAPGTGGRAAFDVYTQTFESLRNGETDIDYGNLINRYTFDTVSRGNYENYAQTDDDTFYYVTRIGNTVISAKVDKEYADEIMAFMDEIGY